MFRIWDYFIVTLLSLVIIVQLLRIAKIIFQPRWLAHRLFDFPESRLVRIFYYGCSILVMLLAILLKLDLLE